MHSEAPRSAEARQPMSRGGLDEPEQGRVGPATESPTRSMRPRVRRASTVRRLVSCESIPSVGKGCGIATGVRADLVDRVFQASITPARQNERAAMEPIIESFIAGLGANATALLSAYMDRAAARLIGLVTDEQRRFASKPHFTEVTELVVFGPVRQGRPATSNDRFGAITKGVGYEGWTKSIYAQVWFDSSTERDLALILDDGAEVASWARLPGVLSSVVQLTGQVGPRVLEIELHGVVGQCLPNGPRSLFRRLG